jgi:DNA-binding Lrp family transcriptional regulator
MTGPATPPAKLDAVDLKLLRLLQADARCSNKDLALAVGVAQSTCLERIRNLVRSGVVRGWHADVDPAALGRSLMAVIHVRLQPKTTASVRAFRTEILGTNEVLTVSTVTGADDFEVEVAVADVAHLRDFVLEHITNRASVVDARTSLIYDQVRVWEVKPADWSSSRQPSRSKDEVPQPTRRLP